MKRHLTSLIALLVVSTAFAWEPSATTNQVVQEAIAFTDGFIVPCANTTYNEVMQRNVKEEAGGNGKIICVTYKNTAWNEYDIMKYSTYGFNAFTLAAAWEQETWGGYSVAYATHDAEAVFLFLDPVDSTIYYEVMEWE